MDGEGNVIVYDDGSPVAPLAERACMAYSRFILDNNKVELIRSLLEKLKNISAKYPQYIYLPYYMAKMMLKIGEKDDCFKYISSFARKKRSDFWVWDLFAETYSDDETRLKFYAKALSCKTKREMSVKVRIKMAFLLMKMGYPQEAFGEFMLVRKIYEDNGWQVRPEITNAIASLSAKGIVPKNNNVKFFGALAKDVDSIVFGSNKFVWEKHGNYRTRHKNKETFPFEGHISITDKGFGFVSVDDKDVFVPANLLDGKNIKTKDIVAGLYVSSIDLKKNKQGWRAVEIEKLNYIIRNI